MARITSFLDPFADPTDGGFQAVRGMYALATGGLWGVGLGNSAMKWNLLPHAESDYIFAIIGEELGFLGCLVVVALYGVLAYAGFRIARRSADRFIQLASVAITVWIVGQAAMNMGYVVGLLPVTGVQLPLISAGGTSLVLTLFIVGLLARFARSEPAAIEAERARDRGRLARIFLPVPESAVDPVRPRRRPEDRPSARPVVGSGGGRSSGAPRAGAGAARRRRGASRRRSVAPPVTRPGAAAPGRRRRGAPRRAGGSGDRHRAQRRPGRWRHRRAHRADARPRRCAAPPADDGGELRITCLGTARGMETRLVPARGYDLRLIPPVPLPRKPTVDLLRVPGRVWRAVAETRALLDELRADVVVGFGGYVALPAYLAARRGAGAGRRARAERAARASPTGSAPGSPRGSAVTVARHAAAQGRARRHAAAHGDQLAGPGRPPGRGPGGVRPGRRPADPAGVRRLAGRRDAEPGRGRGRRRADRGRGAGAARPRAEEHRRDGSRAPGG